MGVPTGAGNPHGNAFVAQETLLATEKEAQRRVNSATARFWRVVNPGKQNRLGRPVGYRLVPGENCPPLVQPDATIMRRAGFTANHVWVTPYSPEERFAAGEYPNQHPTGDGLPHWTKANRNVDDTEIESVVRVRPQPCSAPGGLAGDAGGDAGIPIPSGWIFRAQSRDGCAAAAGKVLLPLVFCILTKYETTLRPDDAGHPG